jgi:hypothetical protein
MKPRLSREGFDVLYAQACTDFRKNILSVAEMLLEKGYNSEQLLGILSLYFGS